MLKVNAHGGVLPRRRASSSRRDGVRGSGHPGGASAEQECGDLQLPSVGAREVMACAGPAPAPCSGSRIPSNTKETGGVLLFTVILQDAAAGHSPLSPSCRRRMKEPLRMVLLSYQ
jgi:hypothetical protein